MKLFAFAKSHWELAVAGGGLFGTITFSGVVSAAIGLGALGIILLRLFIWYLRARMSWRNRNNTNFFIKSKDEDTET